MNKFNELFKKRIEDYWEGSESDVDQQLLDDILNFANNNPLQFKKDFEEIKYDLVHSATYIVLEALSKDTKTWGSFYVNLVEDIIKHAKINPKQKPILNILDDFIFIEDIKEPFVQEIFNILLKELKSENINVKIAVIWNIPNYYYNNSIKNKRNMVDSMRELLYDSNWKVRVAAYSSLECENLLPNDYSLSLSDRILKLFFGVPM